jgi:hypothetical protein
VLNIMISYLPRLFCLIFIVGVHSQAYSQEWQTQEATGHGATEGEATVSALLACIRQANGMTISSRNNMQTRFEEVMDEATTELTATSVIEEKIESHTKGMIESYTKTEVSENEDGEFIVTVNARVVPYDPLQPLKGSKMPVVVAGFRNITDQKVTAKTLKTFKNQLSGRLTASQKFRIQDRDFFDILNEEQAVDDKKMYADCARIGADLIVVGELQQLTGAFAQVGFKMLNVWNSESVIEKIIDCELSPTEQARCKKTGESPSAMLLKKAAIEITDWVFDTVFPITVVYVQASSSEFKVARSGDQFHVIINESQFDSLEDEYELFALGKEVVVDGESYGRTKTVVGKLRIVSSEPKFSTAELTDSTEDRLLEIEDLELGMRLTYAKPTVNLSQGAPRIEKGALLEAFHLGKKTQHPTIPNTFIQEEKFLGTVRVIRSDPNASVAQAEDFKLAMLQPGDICKLIKNEYTTEEPVVGVKKPPTKKKVDKKQTNSETAGALPSPPSRTHGWEDSLTKYTKTKWKISSRPSYALKPKETSKGTSYSYKQRKEPEQGEVAIARKVELKEYLSFEARVNVSGDDNGADFGIRFTNDKTHVDLYVTNDGDVKGRVVRSDGDTSEFAGLGKIEDVAAKHDLSLVVQRTAESQYSVWAMIDNVVKFSATVACDPTQTLSTVGLFANSYDRRNYKTRVLFSNAKVTYK